MNTALTAETRKEIEARPLHPPIAPRAFRYMGESVVFFGTNALASAFGHVEGRTLSNGFPETVYPAVDPALDGGTAWSEGKRPWTVKVGGPYIVDRGVHAKVYLLGGRWVVLSSQNNGWSPLVEHAVVFECPKAHSWFLERIRRIAETRGSDTPETEF